METINSRLANILLIEKGLTAYEIGKNIGVSTQSIDNWLKEKKGKYVMPGADAVAKICEAYSINTEYALTGVGQKYTNKIVQVDRELDSPEKPKNKEISKLQSEVFRLNKMVTEITNELIGVQKKYTELLERQINKNEKQTKPINKKIKRSAKELKVR